MENKKTGLPTWGYFLIGAGIGAVTALLFAPKSGEALRGDIVDTAHRGADYINTGMHQIKEDSVKFYEKERDKAAGMIAAGKDLIHEKKEKVMAAVAAGKEAYRHKNTAVIDEV